MAIGRFLGQAGRKSGQGVAMVTKLLQSNSFPLVGLQNSKKPHRFTRRVLHLLLMFGHVNGVQSTSYTIRILHSCHWCLALALVFSRVTGVQSCHWNLVLSLVFSLVTGVQSCHWYSVLPLVFRPVTDI